jgi:tetratricopeptide (TPR) repeat protein
MSRVIAVVLVAVVVLLVGSFRAPLVAQRRVDLIDEGVALREEGRDEEALALFEQAYAQTNQARALAQIALAEQALGRFVEAEAHLADALGHDEDAFIRRNRVHLEAALEEIRLRVGDLTVEGGAPGAEVIIGGQAVGVLPLDAPVRVVAGSVAVEVRASGYERFIDTVQVRGGGSATVTARLVPSSNGTTRRVPVDEEETQRTDGQSDRSAPPGWVLPTGIALAAVGVVGIALGSGLLAVREDRAQQRLTCSDTEPECRNAYGAALDAEGGGIASFVIGGALLAGGGTILVLGMTGALGTGETTDDDEAHVRCMPGALSIACEGRF